MAIASVTVETSRCQEHPCLPMLRAGLRSPASCVGHERLQLVRLSASLLAMLSRDAQVPPRGRGAGRRGHVAVSQLVLRAPYWPCGLVRVAADEFGGFPEGIVRGAGRSLDSLPGDSGREAFAWHHDFTRLRGEVLTGTASPSRLKCFRPLDRPQLWFGSYARLCGRSQACLCA